MSEVGEKSKAAKETKPLQKGKVKVSVRDICTGKRIEGATVSVEGKKKTTASDEDLLFDDQHIGNADIKVSKHFTEADYIKFLIHNIALINKSITRSYKAVSTDKDLVIVEENKTSKVRVELHVFKVVDSVRFCREHLRFKPELNYGHWWIEIGNKSYGWWPEAPLGPKEMQEPTPPPTLPNNASTVDKINNMTKRAAYSVAQARYNANYSTVGAYGQAFGKTFAGVPGILNGDEDRKLRERDPHHGDWIDGSTDEDYHPVIDDCRTKDEIHQAIRDYAFAYSGNWSWRLEGGNNCHTFQVGAMNKLHLDKVKKI